MRFAFLAFLALVVVVRAGEWQTLHGCQLVENPANDGDSFHVIADGQEHIFRLYFVDCPEAEAGGLVTERIKQQAVDFGISESAVVEMGKKAAAFSLALLSRPFTVLTRWQDALGQSRMGRVYAFITTADGQDLGEVLLQRGLARSHGQSAAPPDDSIAALWSKYDAAQAQAKAAKVGAWGENAESPTMALPSGDVTDLMPSAESIMADDVKAP